MSPSPTVVVIGGGIAGLTSAYYLRRYAQDRGIDLDLAILEREGRWGGKIRTERLEGFVIEGGPDTFVSTKPWGVELCRQLGLEGRLQGANLAPRRVFVLKRGHLVELPAGLAMMIPTQMWPILKSPLLSPLGKLRLGLDFLLPARREDGDESLGAFVSRRLGRQAYERLIEPLVSGIYAGDGDRLSLASTFPFLSQWERQYGSLARGALALRGRRDMIEHDNEQRSIFLTPRSGLAEVVEGLIANLQGAGLRLGTEARALQRTAAGWRVPMSDGSRMEAAAVVLATPAFASARLLANLDRALANTLTDIPYVSTATVSLAYHLHDLPQPLEGHGYVIPRIEGRRALACTWTSTKFPNRAPEDKALLRVFIGRTGQEEELPFEESGLAAIARQEVADTMGITADPILTRAYRWPQAMPQYNLGHPDRLRVIQRRLEDLPGLFLAGAGYRGIGIPDCIHSGEQAATAALDYLSRNQG